MPSGRCHRSHIPQREFLFLSQYGCTAVNHEYPDKGFLFFFSVCFRGAVPQNASRPVVEYIMPVPRKYDMTDEPKDPRNYPDYIRHTYEFAIPAGQKPERLDAFLARSIHNATRTKVQKAIDDNAVLLNGRPIKASRKIQPGDTIVCHVMKPPPLELLPENIPLDILYEDEDLLVVNKPAGMVTHPGFGNRYGTLVNALLYHFGVRDAQIIETDDEDEDEADEGLMYQSDAIRPGIVHRLDKDTSGILVVAKHAHAHAMLAKQFAERTAKREYQAIVWGMLKADSGTIEGNLARSPRDRKIFAVVKKDKGGKHAITDYRALERFDFLTLVSLSLQTGRTHQIRVHCSHIGHPLFSDTAYGGSSAHYAGAAAKQRQHVVNLFKLLPRQALHAKTLAFRHPASGAWMEFDSELPADFQALLDAIRPKTADVV